MTSIKSFLTRAIVPCVFILSSCNSNNKGQTKSNAVLDTVSLSSKSFALAYQDHDKIVATSIDTMKQISFGGATNPAISPDGNKLAYTVSDSAGKRSIWVADLENKSQLQIQANSKNFHSAVWSPDGNYIAFSIGTDQGNKIVWKVGIIKTDNTGLLVIDSKSALNAFSPTWKNENEIVAHDMENLYTFSITGKLAETTPLSSLLGKEYNISSSNRFFYANHGNKMIFNSGNGKPVEELHGMADGIFALDLQTKNVTRISPEGMHAPYLFVTADDRIFYSGAEKPFKRSKIYFSDLNGNTKILVEKGSNPSATLK